MGNSTLVTRSHTHTALAESEQRMRMVELRSRIFESQVLDLAIAMAVSGRDLHIDRETGKLVGEEMLEAKVRSNYVTMLCHKLVSTAQIPKEVISPQNNLDKWADIIAAETDKEAGDVS